MLEAMHYTYPNYNLQNSMDKLKDARDRASLNKTMEALHLDPKKEENLSLGKLLSLQFGLETPTEDDEAITSFNTQVPIGNSTTNYPLGKLPLNYFYYNPYVDFSDYKESTFPEEGFISPKKDREIYFANNISDLFLDLFERKYHNPRNANLNQVIIPSIDKDNEEKAPFIRKRSYRERYLTRILDTSTENNINEFLFCQTDDDVSKVTEDEMDQALFEAQYTKPPMDSEPYKSNIEN